MTFDYLTQLYEEYKLDDASGDAEHVKMKIASVQKKLFDEFIPRGCENEINISWENRKQLVKLMEKDQLMDTVESGLHLYDNAMSEAYRLLKSMYGYDFANFLKRK